MLYLDAWKNCQMLDGFVRHATQERSTTCVAKQRFRIPSSLDVSYFDMEFHLKTKNGLGVSKPVSAKTLFAGFIAIFGWFYLTFQTFIGKGGIGYAILFTLLYATLVTLLVKSDRTGRMGLELILSLASYLPKHGRLVKTRLTDTVDGVHGIFNIDRIDVEDGLIQFADKRVGRVYHVVGSASSLLFEDDKHVILDKVESFYRKLAPGTEVVYDTVYEGHAVDEQLATVRAEADALKTRSDGLYYLLAERENILEKAINNSQGLASLHQYVLVMASNEVALRDFDNLVMGDVEQDGVMFRLARTLTYDETVRYLRRLVSEM